MAKVKITKYVENIYLAKADGIATAEELKNPDKIKLTTKNREIEIKAHYHSL